MDIYVAIKDQPDAEDSPTNILGAFSNEDLARKACQSDADEDAEINGYEPQAMPWQDDYADVRHGDSRYTVRYTIRLVTLDEPTYC